MLELHLSRSARDKYHLQDFQFSRNGKLLLPNHEATRRLTAEVNNGRRAMQGSEQFIPAGQVNALATIESIFHFMLQEYYTENAASIRKELYPRLVEKIGQGKIDEALNYFVDQYPPQEVHKDRSALKPYLNASVEGLSNKQLALEEMVMLWLTNQNPAAEPYNEFFNDSSLRKRSAYDQVIKEIKAYFAENPGFGPDDQDLVTLFRSPAIAAPNSLRGQLEYIRERWGKYLGDFLLSLLGSLDMLKEEEKLSFTGPGPSRLPDYTDPALWGDLPEIERFSKDSDWMPRVVMIAKNSFVWLSQLSQQYSQPIERLDQIPDQVLDDLARWGFTGLWLIGLWERSEASRRIKQMCGNPDAVSSAYSLSRYQIAERLGGDRAYQNLSERCALRGIRLASDMVPNHMGIDSDWVYDHPDWFINQDLSPFPAYSFDGVDLSQRPGISINLEDHYYSRSDAAVVFKHFDHHAGRTRYIYHGNDGTSMPWNDTAQLDYLNPVVREAVIQTILDVARKFPIIRFDAAMTLTKKHYQRLWFPIPGTGGDIPSRADHAMTKAQFDEAMPEEFWREVVERVAKEVPDTLLLAEAFWMMEGYFVRSLGMHRVYNSAFMNMMRNEENAKYRELIKSTLIYDPQILQRYVNFMNNPDEKTAVEQFGKGDKYFGICTLMATMPGLPMFGHGQLEGFSEKYGMEYYKPYWDETPDDELLRQHRRRISPLLHQRWLFANVENFRLFNFETEAGVDENVFAYSNKANGKVGFVVYNNRYGSTAGWVKQANPYLVKGDSAGLQSQSLADSLGYHDKWGFLKYRDLVSGLTYLRKMDEVHERGLFFQLDGYSHQVLLDFEQVDSPEYQQLYRQLGGRGSHDLEAARQALVFQPVLEPLRSLLIHENLAAFLASSESEVEERSVLVDKAFELLNEARQNYLSLKGIDPLEQPTLEPETKALLEQVIGLETLGEGLGLTAYARVRKLLGAIHDDLEADPRSPYLILIWAFLSDLFGKADEAEAVRLNQEFLREAPVAQLLAESLMESGYSDCQAASYALALGWMVADFDLADYFKAAATPDSEAEQVASAETGKILLEYLGVNRYNEVDWYNGDRFDQMLAIYPTIATVRALAKPKTKPLALKAELEDISSGLADLKQAASLADYQYQKLLKALS